VEGTETVALALSSGFGYTLGGQVSAAVTITDNDTTTPPPATTPPAAPSGIAGTVVSGNRIDVRWTDNANNETGFEIQRSLVYNFLSPTNVTVNTANLSSYSDTTLNPNTYYYFRVRARNAAGVSSWSSSVKLKTSSSTTTPTIPAAPTNPSATADSSSQITVRWTDTSNNETGFRILRYNSDPNDPFISTTPTYFTVGAGVTSFVDTGHSPNTTRWYHVQSYNAAGNSVYSSRVSATTFPVVTPTVPAAPTSPGATANSSSQITVTWGDASNNETGFRIQRSTTSNFASVTEFTVGAGVTSFVNTGLTANTTYYYRVQSYNGTGPSAYTTGVNATTQAAPVGGTGPLTAPTSLAVTVSRLSALVNWNDNSNNETGWEIQISTVYNFTAATSRIVSVPTINAETFNVTGLNAGTWYYFRVRAVNTTNVSSWTGSIKLKTLS
jgi:titin